MRKFRRNAECNYWFTANFRQKYLSNLPFLNIELQLFSISGVQFLRILKIMEFS